MPQLYEIQKLLDKDYYAVIEQHGADDILIIRPTDNSRNYATTFIDAVKRMSVTDFTDRILNPAMASLTTK